MNTVIIINLNGVAYHIEQPGYEALRQYLDAASHALKDNPDRDEIMKDLKDSLGAAGCGQASVDPLAARSQE